MKFDPASLKTNHRITKWLQENQNQIQSLFPSTIDIQKGIYLDLSAPDPRKPEETELFIKDIENLLKAHSAPLAIGRYDEHRHCYQSSIFKNRQEARTLHIGVDLFVPPGTEVRTPIEASVHSFNNNDNFLDYGPTIILQHTITTDLVFYSLYGHLSTASLQRVEVGQVFKAGETFATVGHHRENGQWPPHVHVQLISDMLDMQGDFPGVVAPSERKLWLDLCPNPRYLLKLPEPSTTTTASLIG